MKSNYGRGLSCCPEYSLIFPAEAMTGNPFHDYGVYCAMLMALKVMSQKELEKVADLTPPQYRKPIAETYKKIVREHSGYIWRY